jgi:hypothetical protein
MRPAATMPRPLALLAGALATLALTPRAAAAAAAAAAATAAAAAVTPGAPPAITGMWATSGWAAGPDLGLADASGYAFIVPFRDGNVTSPAAVVGLGQNYTCVEGQEGAFEATYAKTILAPSGAALAGPFLECELDFANATSFIYTAPGAGGACPVAAGGAALRGVANARRPSAMPDLSAGACPAAGPAAPPAPALGDAAAAVDVGAAFPPFALPGGAEGGAGSYASREGFPSAALVGLVSPRGAASAAWLPGGDGVVVQLGDYISHECTGPHAWRSTLAVRTLFLRNGTVAAAAACEAVRWDPAARRRVALRSATACPPADFAAADATSDFELLFEVPGLGDPDAVCGGGAAAAAPANANAAAAAPASAAAAAPESAAAARWPAAAAAAALAAGLAL